MKKKLYLISFLIIFFSILYLNSEGYRYTGVNYVIKEHKISNFQKLSEFYERHINYKKLVKKITYKSKNQQEKIIDISTWVYENIKKISFKDDIIDDHPWTIVERKIGTNDQFSDILSVLLVHNNIDSFFKMKINNTFHSITFFKYNTEWSIIDPYYGIYFTNTKKSFSSLEEIKDEASIKKDKNVKKNNFLHIVLVFIISFIALIIFIDTFKSPISIIVPNIEFLLYNLYETFRDIKLFIKDLN